MDTIITKEYLEAHPKEVFVFGDNTIRRGLGGAARLRDMPNVYGFITKKFPNNNPPSFYTKEEYRSTFESEMTKLIAIITTNPDRTFLISRLGGGLANRHKIFENIIKPGLMSLIQYKNVKFLFNL